MSRIVLISGGSRGIGRAIAEQLAPEHRVAITYRTLEPQVRQSLEAAGVLCVPCELTDPASIEAAFDEVERVWGPVEILIANAGMTRDSLLLRMADEDLDAVINANLAGSIRMARRALRGMVRARWGRIVFVSSVVGLTGSAGQVNYAAAKAGLVGAARSLAREVGSRGITVNVVAPGFVATDMTAVLEADRRAEILATVPLGRYAEPHEIAAVTAFLASEAAGYITGAIIPVDGGLGMGH